VALLFGLAPANFDKPANVRVKRSDASPWVRESCLWRLLLLVQSIGDEPPGVLGCRDLGDDAGQVAHIVLFGP
jgi:hypothetical protein